MYGFRLIGFGALGLRRQSNNASEKKGSGGIT